MDAFYGELGVPDLEIYVNDFTNFDFTLRQKWTCDDTGGAP
jgi:hypothetical protein